MEKKNQYEVTEKDLKELKEILSVDSKEVQSIIKPIIFDGVQYSIRIPKKFVEAAHIQIGKDQFKFELDIHEDRAKVPTLRGVLVRE